MPACCIANCGARKKKNQPQFSLHRFPKNEGLRKKWLEAIGQENINRRHKYWHICSFHFEDRCFNRTLDVTRLHDNSVPTIFSRRDTEDEQPKMETEDEETRDADVPMKKKSGPSAKFKVQKTPAFRRSKMAKVKTVSNPIESDGDSTSEEEALWLDENPETSDDDQTNEDLVPLSAHPVPLSEAPDPLCDVEVKEEEINEAAQEGDGTVKEGHRSVGGMPAGVLRQGAPLRGELPPTPDVFQTRKLEQKIKNLTRRCERDRKNVDNLLNTLRRRDRTVSELQQQVDALSRFVLQQHGAQVLDELVGGAGITDWKSKKRYRLMVQRWDERISELQAEVDSLRSATRAGDASRRGSAVAAPGTPIYSIKKDELMKKANRQLLIIERDNRHKSPDIRQKSVQSTSGIRQKSSVQGKAEVLRRLLVTDGNTSGTRQKTLVDTKPTSLIEEKNSVSLEHTPRKFVQKIDIFKNPLVVMEPVLDSPQMPSVGAKRKLEVRPKSLPIKLKPVIPKIGNKRKSNIRQNYKKVIQPKLFVRQEKSSDIPQTSVSLQRTSDFRQNALLIQIDGMQNVIQPKLVRLEENTMDIG